MGIGIEMRAISINGIADFLSIARNLLLSDALFQLQLLVGGALFLAIAGNFSALFIGKNLPDSYLHKNRLKSAK